MDECLSLPLLQVYLQSVRIITLQKPLETAWYNSLVASMLLWKYEESTHITLLDET